MRATRLLLFVLGVVVTSLAFGGSARAADWPMVQGTEPKDAPLVRPFGFVQVVGEGALGGSVNGKTPTFNRLENGATWGFSVRRARPGLRGAIPGTDGRVSYFLLGEFGTAAIARDGPTLTDAFVTFGYVPGARFRAGQFKLPVMDEAVEANPIASEWINFSLPAAQLVNENPIRDGKFDGGASGFRDVGVEAFDTFTHRKLALSYAVMLSNGRRGFADEDANKDVTARTTLAWVFAGKPTDPLRQELSVFAWGQRGERNVSGTSVQRVRSGAGVLYDKESIRVRAEVVHASGAVFAGQSPPFPGEPLVVAPRARALGWYVQGRVRVLEKARIGLRYDELHRDYDNPRAERVFRSLSPMLEYDPVPRVRIQAQYDKRWLDAPGGTADAKTIARSYGDRVALQVTVVF